MNIISSKTHCITLLAWILGIFSTQCWAQTPTPLSTEKKISLNGLWSFKTDPNNLGETQAWFASNYNTNGWDSMQVPGNWDTRNEYAYYVGKAWYQLTSNIPAEIKGQTVRLYFESVYHDSKVWLNGELLGESNSGYLPFEFDVTNKLKYGSANTLVVCTDNTFKRGAMWNWGGIRRPVYLIVNNKLRIVQQHITAKPDLKNGTATVMVKVTVRNEADQTQTATLLPTLTNKAGEKTYTWEQKNVQIAPHSSQTVDFSTVLPQTQTHLWHFDNPYLYEIKSTLTSDGREQHERSNRFGIRKVEVDSLSLKLNGEAVRTVGFNLVPDDRTTGNTLPLWRVKQDIDLMKAAGANMARLTHLPVHDEMLDYLDEKGIMVFAEIPLWGKDVLVEKNHPVPHNWMQRMVQKDYNHPAIIGWSVGNEIGFLNENPQAMEYVQAAIQSVRQEMDSSRLLVYVSHSAAAQAKDPVQFADLIMFNKYDSHGKSAEKAHQYHPGKPIFFAEYGNKLTSDDPDKGVIDIAYMLNQMRNKPYVIGASLWTFNDYRSLWRSTAPGWATAPSENRAWGAINVFRQKKKAYYTVRKEYAPIARLQIKHNYTLAPGRKINTTIRIVPRSLLDIPAYTLRNYTLVWEVKNSVQQTLSGGFQPLPVIKPGNATWTNTINWSIPAKGGSALRISLLSPLDYAVYDTVVFLQKPAKPIIKHVIAANNMLRVIFDKQADATAYTLRCKEGNTVMQSDTTINNYLEIKKLDNNKTYAVELIALNSQGASEPSVAYMAKPSFDLAPPIVYHTEPADKAFFVGYSVDNEDYLFLIEYGEKPGVYTHLIKTSTRGTAQVTGLENGKTYYFRIKKLTQWSLESAWSEEYAVTPDGGQLSAQPIITGLTRRGTDALVTFVPVPKAEHYVLAYTGPDGKTQNKTINTAQTEHYLLKGLRKGQKYTFRLYAANANGLSQASAAIIR